MGRGGGGDALMHGGFVALMHTVLCACTSICNWMANVLKCLDGKWLMLDPCWRACRTGVLVWLELLVDHAQRLAMS